MPYKLFTDSEIWQREYPINTTLLEMTGAPIGSRFRIVAYYGSSKEYRMDKTGYTFCVRIVD